MPLKPIKQDSKLGILAPAFPPDPEKLRKGIDYLLSLGYEIDLGDSLTSRHGYFAGNDQLRLNDLHRMFNDPGIDAIICARGGWGGLRILDQIDYELIKNNPKLLVGYSDVTTLQLAMWQKAGVPAISGPMAAVEMGNGILPFTSIHFWNQINNPNNFYDFNYKNEGVETWSEGTAKGTLLGGCLSMVAHQLGTPYSVDYQDAILFLEDVGEEPYKIDRYLAQLKQAGVFEKISGLILGDFIDCIDNNPDRTSFTLKEILQDYFGHVSFPVIFNFPYGHGMKKFSMPNGARAKLNTKQNQLKVQNLFVS